MELEDEEWEICNDDGFVYKRKRRRLDPTAPVAAAAAAEEDADAEKRRRERKRQTLLKVKAKYEKEMNEWESLSNTLRSMQHTAACQLQIQREEAERAPLEQTKTPSSLAASTSSTDSVGGSLLDELLLQVEAQEAIIHDISNLCDIAEAMCSKREQQFKQSLFDLPIWASPLELMQVLCDD